MTFPAVHALALAALVPAAVNPSLLLRGKTIEARLCGGGALSIPLDDPLPGSDGTACCAKGCHAGDRRRLARSIP